MAENLPETLNRMSIKCGFNRKFFIDNNLPTLFENIVIVPFFGDIWGSCIFSSFILKRLKDQNKDKYYILCSWPGFRDLFPYMDEFWEIRADSDLKNLAMGSIELNNTASGTLSIVRNLNRYFSNVLDENWNKMYDGKFTDEYYGNFGDVKCYLPTILSSTFLDNSLQKAVSGEKGVPIVLFPTQRVRSWQNGKVENISITKEFWIILIERLLNEGYFPICWQNFFTYDLSDKFTYRCEYMVNKDIKTVFATLYSAGLALDLFSGFSRLASMARCPYVAVDERMRFYNSNELFLNQITHQDCLPRQYLFAFSAILLNQGNVDDWNRNILNGIMIKLEKLKEISKNCKLLSTIELDKVVDIVKIKSFNTRKMGIKFIKGNSNYDDSKS